MQVVLSVLLFALLVGIVVAGPNGPRMGPGQARPRKGDNVRVDRVWKTSKKKCEQTICGKMVPEEAYNCVNSCISSYCYGEVYAENPLEDGEIDSIRNREFTSCVRQEVRNEKYKKN